MPYVLQQPLSQSAKLHPDKLAISARGKGLTYRELEERLVEELDYRTEARNTMEFHRLYAGDSETVIPRVIGDLSSRRVLTMTYLDGYRLSDLMNLPNLMDPSSLSNLVSCRT